MDQTQEAPKRKQAYDVATKPLIWDCGSSLYDSFELKSFERQLDSAISSRSLSMPHLSERRIDIIHRRQPPPATSQPKKSSSSSSPSKISRSLQKLLRSVFRHKQTGGTDQIFRVPEQSRGGGSFYVVYDKSGGALSTIPEAPEFDSLSPEMRSLVRRTGSERFTTAASIGISCA